MDFTLEALEIMSKSITKEGVTSFLPTTMTGSYEHILNAVHNVSDNRNNVSGANILGVHLEGPFINRVYKEAQPGEHIQAIDLEKLENWNKRNIIKIITAAPELENFDKLIEFCKINNIRLSVKHSAATFEKTQIAVYQGVNNFTHAYNAMSGFSHREGGVVGAMLVNSDATVELIADGIHVHEPAIKLLYKAKGPNRIILVTDAIRAKGLSNGESELGGQKVNNYNGIAKLEDGQLAGSVLKYDDGFRHVHKVLELSLVELSKMASLNPARNIGVSDTKGSIAVGKDADLVILDENLNVIKTIVKGKVVY